MPDHALLPARGVAATREGPNILSPFLPHLSAARRYAARKVPPDRIDDVLQDALLRIASQHGDGRRDEVRHPKSYLLTVVRAVIVDGMRHDGVRHRKAHCELTAAHHPVDTLCPFRVLMGRQALGQVMARLDAMPADTRAMLLAVRVEGISFKAAAGQFGVSVSTVEKRVARALAVLAGAMQE